MQKLIRLLLTGLKSLYNSLNDLNKKICKQYNGKWVLIDWKVYKIRMGLKSQLFDKKIHKNWWLKSQKQTRVKRQSLGLTFNWTSYLNFVESELKCMNPTFNNVNDFRYWINSNWTSLKFCCSTLVNHWSTKYGNFYFFRSRLMLQLKNDVMR